VGNRGFGQHEHRGDEQQADLQQSVNPVAEGVRPRFGRCNGTGANALRRFAAGKRTRSQNRVKLAKHLGDVLSPETVTLASVRGRLRPRRLPRWRNQADWLALSSLGIHQNTLPEMGSFFAYSRCETFSKPIEHHGRPFPTVAERFQVVNPLSRKRKQRSGGVFAVDAISRHHDIVATRESKHERSSSGNRTGQSASVKPPVPSRLPWKPERIARTVTLVGANAESTEHARSWPIVHLTIDAAHPAAHRQRR